MNDPIFLIAAIVVAFIIYKKIKANRIKAQLAVLDFNDVQLLDVRSESEFVGFHAPGSLNIPVQALLAGNTAELNKQKTLVVYCASGMRSAGAVTWLKKQGYNAINAGTVGYVVQHLNASE